MSLLILKDVAALSNWHYALLHDSLRFFFLVSWYNVSSQFGGTNNWWWPFYKYCIWKVTYILLSTLKIGGWQIMPESALCLNSTCLLHLVMSIHVTYNLPNQGARVSTIIPMNKILICVETEIYCHMCLFSDASFLMVWYVFIQCNVENEYLDCIFWEMIQECKRLVLRYKQFCVPHFSPLTERNQLFFPFLWTYSALEIVYYRCHAY